MKAKSLISEEVIVEVPFHDVDVMHVAWHGHYVKYFELARTALTRRFDFDYPEMEASGYMWPIIDLNVRYVHFAKYGRKLRVLAELVEWELRMKINYTVFDAETGKRLTKGSTTQVAVAIESGELQLGSPRVLREKLEAAGVQL